VGEHVARRQDLSTETAIQGIQKKQEMHKLSFMFCRRSLKEGNLESTSVEQEFSIP
jgi:hypothetical protein